MNNKLLEKPLYYVIFIICSGIGAMIIFAGVQWWAPDGQSILQGQDLGNLWLGSTIIGVIPSGLTAWYAVSQRYKKENTALAWLCKVVIFATLLIAIPIMCILLITMPFKLVPIFVITALCSVFNTITGLFGSTVILVIEGFLNREN